MTTIAATAPFFIRSLNAEKMKSLGNKVKNAA